MKSYTSLEQAKTLAEFLPLESADMRFCFSHTLSGRITGHYPMIGREPSMGTIPCWSLVALLDIIDSVKMYVMNRVTMIVGKYAANQWFVELERVHDNSSAMLTASKQLIDACVEMIVKLHEQKLL